MSWPGVRRLSLGARIFLVYALFVLAAGYFIGSTISHEIKPGVRESTEETLVDTANLLAEMLRDDVARGTLTQSRLAEALSAYGERHPQAEIWGIEKTGVSHRIYVTDRHGVVLVDSTGRDIGHDYSRWNDVYRTLHGMYGARSTREQPDDPLSTVMYVAAPIRSGTDIIGVVTVAKPNRTLEPYILRSERRLAWLGGALVLTGLALGAAFSWWVSRSTRTLRHYAQVVSAGRRVEAPTGLSGEFGELAAALEQMRTGLEGKARVERYAEHLTHELKSPLAAIQASAELLREELPGPQRARFLDHIDVESARMRALADRLLSLAQVEQRRGLQDRSMLSLRALVEDCAAALQPRLAAAGLRLRDEVPEAATVSGEAFLLERAIGNLLDNAVDFATQGSAIRVTLAHEEQWHVLSVRNDGEPVPEFALPRLTERFYSLPRPDTGRKSTGLGLNFVAEVAELHGGRIEVWNVPGGVEARLYLPATDPVA